MPFFEPLPPQPPERSPDQPTGWRPPLWDRPSEALLGAPVDAAIVLGRGERAAVVFDNVRAYPNGFAFSLSILRNPMTPRDPMGPGFMGRGHPLGPGGPRIGFEFSDGTRAQIGGPARGGFPPAGTTTQMLVAAGAGSEPRTPFGVPVDADGVPVAPVLMMRGGGGNGERFDTGFWCFPLPPPGPMTIFSEWPDEGIDESATPFDADRIRRAVPRVVTLWETDT
jgi:hypothetical protein